MASDWLKVFHLQNHLISEAVVSFSLFVIPHPNKEVRRGILFSPCASIHTIIDTKKENWWVDRYSYEVWKQLYLVSCAFQYSCHVPVPCICLAETRCAVFPVLSIHCDLQVQLIIFERFGGQRLEQAMSGLNLVLDEFWNGFAQQWPY